VVGLDASHHLPLLLSASEGRWVRVWDWARRQLVAAKQLDVHEPLCCALHPSGLLAAVGTSEDLQVFWILRDSLSRVAQLPVARCSIARYSHGGGMLAAVGRNNTIAVFSVFYGQCGATAAAAAGAAACGLGASSKQPRGASGSQPPCVPPLGAARACAAFSGGSSLAPVALLKGHISSVTAVAWSADDRRLVSVGAGGAVYTWDVAASSRLVELDFVDKALVYCAGEEGGCDRAGLRTEGAGMAQHQPAASLCHQGTPASQ
jgi:WD40 repeat protein